MEPFLFPHLILLPCSTVTSLALLALSPAELPPPGDPCVWGKGSHCFPPAPGCASLGTAQHAVGSPCCLTFNLPKERSCVKLGLTFLSLRHPAAYLLYHGKFIHGSQGYYWSLWDTETRFQKAEGTEITCVKFLMWHFLQEVSDVIKILM